MPTQRGRPAARLTLLTTTPGARRLPPKELTKPQAAIWRKLTATLPEDYFGPDTLPLLTTYCRHVASMEVLALRIDAIEAAGGDDPEYAGLLKTRAQESAVLLRLAQAQRLTQQSRYRADAVAVKVTNAQGAEKPWQTV